MRAFAVTLLSAFAALASAYTQPDYSQNPTGNAIFTPGLNEIVPAGEPYSITWDPTTEGTISLVLLRGPGNNVQPLETIAEGIENTGSYTWTPSTSLEPDTSRYGLLLVVDGTGQYQYSTQFGVSNPSYGASSSVSSAVSSTVAASSSSSSTVIVSTYLSTTTICDCEETATSVPVATGTGSFTLPVVSPTKAPAVPSTLRSSGVAPTGSPSSTGPSSPLFTGAAGHNVVSLGAVAAGVVAVLAF